MTCKHTTSTAGTHYGYVGPVSLPQYQNPAAHGGVTYTETCNDCGATRRVNSTGRHREVGRWVARACATVVAIALSACTTLAPGARDVRMVTDPGSVVNCVPVGSVYVPYNPVPTNLIGLEANQAVGLGANTVLVTSSFPSLQGVAYRCGS